MLHDLALGAEEILPVEDHLRVGEHVAQEEAFAPAGMGADQIGAEALVTQLDDVDAAGQCGLGEIGQVAGVAAGIGAQVEPGGGQPIEREGIRALHEPRLAGCVRWTGQRGSPADRAESGPGTDQGP